MRNSSFSASAFAAAAALVIMPAAPAAAEPIEVTAEAAPSMAAWSSAASGSLGDSLQTLVDTPMRNRNTPEGFVSVRFRVDEAGKPAGIELYHKSGSKAVDDVGRLAVARMRGLPALPTGRESQVIQANIFIASDTIEYRHQLAALHRLDEQRLAANDGVWVLAINAASGASGREE